MNKRPLLKAIFFTGLIVTIFSIVLFFIGKQGEEDFSLFGERIGVIEIRGTITDASRILELLDQFRRDIRTCAIVIRIDSPGGAIGPSQEIYQEIKRTTAVKPVVCSMGSIAASGGLYIAVACTKIIANPGTLTGSIGVISTVPNLQGFLKKIGVKVETIKSGSLKGTGQLDRALTKNERIMLQDISEDYYNQFIMHVAQSRRLSIEKVHTIADGRIFSGRRAQELGLVDELGNYYDAIRLSKRLATLKGWPVLVKSSDNRESWWKCFLKDGSKNNLVKMIVDSILSFGYIF